MPGMGLDMTGPAQNVAPFQMLPPEILAQIAAHAFRPAQGQAPQLGGGLPGMAAPGGSDLGAGMAGLGAGLGAYGRGAPTMIDERGAVAGGDLAKAVSGVQGLKPDANGVWQPPPMPTDIGYGQGGQGAPGFWDGLWGGLKGLF